MDENSPAWLNKKYLQEALKKSEKKDVIVESFKIDAIDEKQYHGGTYRIRVKYSSAERNEELYEKCIFVKSTTSNTFIYNFLNMTGAYNKEIDFYSNVAQKLHQIMLKIDSNSDIFVRSVHIDRQRQILFLEDLSPLKYQTIPLRPGLNFIQAKAILCRLAQFHAASAVLYNQEPTIFEGFKHGLFNNSGFDAITIYTTQMNSMLELISTWPTFRVYTEKLQRLMPNLIERARCAFEPSVGCGFNALIHGDLWTANVLFNHHSNMPFDLKLIDFQFSCWSSPAIDLHFFLNTSLCYEVHVNQLHELVRWYYGELVNALTQLEYERHIPTEDEFNADFKKRSIIGFLMACCFLPDIQCDYPEECLETYLTDTEHARQFKRMKIDSPAAHRILKTFIPIYEQLGVFD